MRPKLTVSQEGSNGALENGRRIKDPTPYLGQHKWVYESLQ